VLHQWRCCLYNSYKLNEEFALEKKWRSPADVSFLFFGRTLLFCVGEEDLLTISPSFGYKNTCSLFKDKYAMY
jgi:hypothetical protein